MAAQERGAIAIRIPRQVVGVNHDLAGDDKKHGASVPILADSGPPSPSAAAKPGGPAPEVWLFDGTVQAECDVGWVINNIWPTDACGEDIPQETHIAYGGSATGQPL